MCGIAGVFNRDGDKVDPQLLVRMTRTLAHRGPDEEGYFLNGMTPGAWAQRDTTRDATTRGHIDGGAGTVGLGHRRDLQLQVAGRRAGGQGPSLPDAVGYRGDRPCLGGVG